MNDQPTRCAFSDLPTDQCAHCGANPGSRINLSIPRQNGLSTRIGNLFDSAPTPPAYEHPQRKLGKTVPGHCACGQPLHNNAYGCDDCADELSRILGDVTWLNEQLAITIARQKGKRPGSSGRANDALPWHLKAANTQRALLDYLQGTVVTCLHHQIRHQSPRPGNPRHTGASMSAWLLWRVDGLQHHHGFPTILKRALALETRILGCIDRGPDLLYLGICEKPTDDGPPCGGAIYAKADEPVGRCRVCNASYATSAKREGLASKLDDMLCTGAEIAKLSTYLGIDADREKVRNIVNQWHKRKRITPAPQADDTADPRFRFGDVAILLAQTYDKGA